MLLLIVFCVSFYLFWLRWVFMAAHRSLVVASRGCSLVLARGLFIAVASLVAEHGPKSTKASLRVVHRLSLPAACRISVSWPGGWICILASEGGILTTGWPGKSLRMPVCIVSEIDAWKWDVLVTRENAYAILLDIANFPTSGLSVSHFHRKCIRLPISLQPHWQILMSNFGSLSV